MDVSLSNLSNEELLLMYVSGELEGDAARHVEAQLARDENLREQFEILKQMDTGLKRWASEEVSQPVTRLDTSMRDALTMMRKHTLTSPLSKSAERGNSRALGWKWRLAIAAILVAGVALMLIKRSSREVAIEPKQTPKNDLVASSGSDGTEYAFMYDMFDAPVTEAADNDSLIQDVAAVNQMAQMLK